jgi:hypothetical protein
LVASGFCFIFIVFFVCYCVAGVVCSTLKELHRKRISFLHNQRFMLLDIDPEGLHTLLRIESLPNDGDAQQLIPEWLLQTCRVNREVGIPTSTRQVQQRGSHEKH